MKNPRIVCCARWFAAVLISLLFVQCAPPVPPELTSPLPEDFIPAERDPQNLTQLLSHASLIVVGRVGPVERYLDFVVYDEDGELLTQRPIDKYGYPMSDMPATDFRIDVETVLRDDGAIAAGKPLLLRIPAHLTEEGIGKLRSIDTSGFEYTYPWTGDRGLFLLAPTPDGEAYSLHDWQWSWLLLEGESLRLSNGVQSPAVLNNEPVTLGNINAALSHPDAAYTPLRERVMWVSDLPRYYATAPGSEETPLAAGERPAPTDWLSPLDPAYIPTLTSLIISQPLIVRGEIGEIVGHHDYTVYDEMGELVAEQPDGAPDRPTTDLLLRVDEVLRSDGKTYPSQEIVLRVDGYLSEEIVRALRNNAHFSDLEFPPVFTGDKGIFILFSEPDGEAYNLPYGPWSLLTESDGVLHLSNGRRAVFTSPEVEGPVTVETFLAAVESAQRTADGFPLPPGQQADSPLPTPDLVPELMGKYFMSRAQAETSAEWLQSGGQRWIDEFGAVLSRVRRAEPTFVTAAHQIFPPFTFTIYFSQPYQGDFAATYLQGYEWAENVVLEVMPDPASYTPEPTPIPTPTVDPVAYYMARDGISRVAALDKIDQIRRNTEQWSAEARELLEHLRQVEKHYAAGWVSTEPIFTVYVRFDYPNPDADAFAEKYLEGYDWADRVVVLGADE